MIGKFFSKKSAKKAQEDFNPPLPDFSVAETFQTAMQLHQTGDLPKAQELYQKILQHEPNHPDALHFLGVLAYQSGQNEVAIALISKAIESFPTSSGMYSNLGLALQAAGQLKSAVEAFQQAVALQSDYADAYYSLGNVLRDLGRIEESVRSYQQALHLQPDYVDAELNLAIALLSGGYFLEGWQHYEARYSSQLKRQGAIGRISFPTFFFPQWQGESIRGKTLLICPEQGFGDEIQFARYLSVLKEQGAQTMTLICKKQLKPLFERMAAVDTVLVANEDLTVQKHDYWTPALSLPLHCKTTLENIPATVPYLYANPEQTKAIAIELDSICEFKVGICWKGDPAHKNDSNRSPGIAAFKPLFEMSGVKLFNLQPDTREEFILNAGNRGVDRGHEIDKSSFEEAAALIANLDLVISCDTSICHLVGALGKPVWIVLPQFTTDWRWMLEREDSPWYPTMRLFRQSEPGNWGEVFLRIEKQLKQVIAEKRVG